MRVDVSAGQVVAATVTHQVHHVPSDRKRDVLTHILTQQGERPGARVLQDQARREPRRRGSRAPRRPAGVIHGNKSQGARSRALDDFKTGRVRVLVATDIAARGLDIAQLPLVVNFDLPLVAEDYVHRVGRTGRAGREGRAVSLVSAADSGLLREIQRLVTAPLERLSSSGDEVIEPGPSSARPSRPRRPLDRRGSSWAGARGERPRAPWQKRAGTRARRQA